MQCLVEASRLYYDCLDSHLENLTKATQFHMVSDSERVSIQAYEFWCSISDEEVERINSGREYRKYCERAFNTIYEVMEYHFKNRDANQEKLSEDAWNNVKAASTLLTNLSQCIGEEIIDRVFNFISQNIQSDQPKIRDSVFLAFGSILETRWNDKIRLIIGDAMNTILGMLQDKSSEVRATVSWCIKKICEFHYVCLRDQQLFNNIIVAIIQGLSSGRKVCVQLCDALHFLVSNLRPDVLNSETNGLISNYFSGLLNKLFELAIDPKAYDKDNNVALASLFTIGSLIDYAPQDCNIIIHDFFPNFYNAFLSTLDPNNFPNDEVRFCYQGYYCTVFSACFSENKLNLSVDQYYAVYDQIEKSFQQRQTVYEEGLMACSSLALVLQSEFAPKMEKFGSFLLYSLQQIEDTSICRIAINSTSDLLRGLGPLMENYMNQLTPTIINILQVKYLIYTFRILALINTLNLKY